MSCGRSRKGFAGDQLTLGEFVELANVASRAIRPGPRAWRPSSSARPCTPGIPGNRSRPPADPQAPSISHAPPPSTGFASELVVQNSHRADLRGDPEAVAVGVVVGKIVKIGGSGTDVSSASSIGTPGRNGHASRENRLDRSCRHRRVATDHLGSAFGPPGVGGSMSTRRRSRRTRLSRERSEVPTQRSRVRRRQR